MANSHKQSGLNWVIASGVVGADIGTSVFYGTGILFPKVGYLAPLFILTACLMMWLFKTTYEEGLALSPYNGGAYSMILRSVGRRLAVVAGALTFVSYLATAAVSALSGAYYLSSLFGGLSGAAVLGLAAIPIIGFGLLNTRGIKEPAKLVTWIAGFHFAFLIFMSIWSFIYLGLNWSDIHWGKLTQFNMSGELQWGMLIYGFAAAFLGITGFESAAQIVEELEEPALETVRKLYRTVIILVTATAPVISIMTLIILSPDEVNSNMNYLLSGLARKLGGQVLVTVLVVDATLTLFAAVNTAFVGFIGLATTMAKQGNLPPSLLLRLAHRFPSVQGYPLIALPFAAVAVIMTAIVAGQVEIVAKVYEIAFLGVMVSFAIGVVLIRNRPLRRGIPTSFLSQWIISGPRIKVPIIPTLSGAILSFAVLVLFIHAESEALLMLVSLFTGTLLAMAYYRWGELERRLESRSDLRLGTGRFATLADLPNDLPKYVLCTGGTGARRLINLSINRIVKDHSSAFELIIFHAEENKDPEGFFFELLQRVVSQQIAPVYPHRDMILTVKILPGSLAEGLQSLKRQYEFTRVIIGSARDPEHLADLKAQLAEEVELDVDVIRT